MIRFDCHAHVYHRVAPAGCVRYVPDHAAPLPDWLSLQQKNGICGGVIVQVSFLGTDNSQMLQALSGLNRERFAGIAVTEPDIPEAALAALAEGGVKGVRWNLVAGAAIPDLASSVMRQLVDSLRALDMHIEVQLESDRLARILPDLAALKLPVVIDHMGLPKSPSATEEPWLDALESLSRRDNVYVKLSAPYRAVVDPRGHVDRLLALLPGERFVWGSDWPHTQHEAEADYAGLLPELEEVIDDAAAVAKLYGLSPDEN
jgi:predicted TIM-barrel fold metal-dependent hydrolase